MPTQTQEMLGEEGTEQFTVYTYVNGRLLRSQKIHDPFITNTTVVRGLRFAWNALFRGIKIAVSVDGSAGAQCAIMTLNPRDLQAETERIWEARRASREAQAQGDYTGDCCAGVDRSLKEQAHD